MSNFLDVISLRILRPGPCSHGLVVTDCFRCQMITFILCNNELQKQLGVKMPKDITQSVLYPWLKEGKKTHVLHFRRKPVDEDEDFAFGDNSGDRDDIYSGLEPISSDQAIKESNGSKELSAVRIIFVGTDEAYYGFWCGLLQKYGINTMIVDGMNFGPEVSDEISIKIMKRWHWGGNISKCIFSQDRHPTAEGCLRIEIDDGVTDYQYFTSENMKEFIKGYYKAMHCTFPKVYDNVSSARFSGDIFMKGKDHEEECPYCLSEGAEDKTEYNLVADRGLRHTTLTTYMRTIEQSEYDQIQVYWYYLDEGKDKEEENDFSSE